MNSVIQKRTDRCIFCQRPAQHKHHIFNGPNRKHSEEWGMTVHVCATCHQLIHNDQNIDIILKKRAQHIFEDKWGRDKFMEIFKKNYLWEEDIQREKSSDNWRE